MRKDKQNIKWIALLKAGRSELAYLLAFIVYT